MISDIPGDIFQAALAGLIAAAIPLARPIRAHIRARRIRALYGDSADAVLEDFGDDLPTRWTPRLVTSALVAGVAVAGLYWINDVLPAELRALQGFAFGLLLLFVSVSVARNFWRARYGDQRDLRAPLAEIEEAPSYLEAQQIRREQMGEVGGAILFFLIGAAMCWGAFASLPDSIAYLKALL